MALKDKVRLILYVKDTPHRISLAFAVGVFIGMSPFFGLHTILGIVVAYLFRFNKLVTLAGVYVTNPWTIIPIYSFSIWVGAKCIGMDRILPDVDWRNLTLRAFANDLSPLLMPFVVGTVLMSVLSSLVSYAIVYHLAKRRNV